jgi:hypothetical protein
MCICQNENCDEIAKYGKEHQQNGEKGNSSSLEK